MMLAVLELDQAFSEVAPSCGGLLRVPGVLIQRTGLRVGDKIGTFVPRIFGVGRYGGKVFLRDLVFEVVMVEDFPGDRKDAFNPWTVYRLWLTRLWNFNEFRGFGWYFAFGGRCGFRTGN